MSYAGRVRRPAAGAQCEDPAEQAGDGAQRLRQADLAVDPRANVVLAGDVNDYQFASAIAALTDNGATLQVVKTCVPYPGPHAPLAKLLLWLLAAVTHNAC